MQPFAFQRCQAADKEKRQIFITGRLTGVEIHDAFALIHILIHTLFISAAQCADHIRGAAHRVAIHGIQGVHHVLLISNTIAAVLRFPVDGVAGDAVDGLLYQRHIVAARPVAGRHGGSHIAYLMIPGVDAVVFKYQWLVPMLLCPQRTSHILGQLHGLSALIVDAQHRGHTVAARAALQRRSYLLAVADASGSRSRACGEAGHKGLLLHTRLCAQRTGSLAQINALVPLVDVVGFQQSQPEQRHQIGHTQAALQLQRFPQRIRQHLTASSGPTEDAQTGFPAQKVSAMRMGLQNPPQGRSSCGSGGHPSIERQGLANKGS